MHRYQNQSYIEQYHESEMDVDQALGGYDELWNGLDESEDRAYLSS